MNFNQKPGIYNAKNDKLIMDYDEAINREIIITAKDAFKYQYHVSAPLILGRENIIVTCKDYKKPHYIILPDSVLALNDCCFQFAQNLVGIYGMGVKYMYSFAFRYCDKIEEIEFPNLSFIEDHTYMKSSPFVNKYLKEQNGLMTIKNILVDIKNDFKDKTLIIPEEIKAINSNLFSFISFNDNIENIIMPTNLEICNFKFIKPLKSITLPVYFNELKIECASSGTKLIYKGSEKQLERLIEIPIKKLLSTSPNLEIIPYTVKELQEKNCSIEQIEEILDRKLTLDELLDTGKTLRQASKYLEEAEISK